MRPYRTQRRAGGWPTATRGPSIGWAGLGGAGFQSQKHPVRRRASGSPRPDPGSGNGILLYVGQGNIAARLRVHVTKAARCDHRQRDLFSGELEASWVELPGTATVNVLQHENDLVAAHVLTSRQAPRARRTRSLVGQPPSPQGVSTLRGGSRPTRLPGLIGTHLVTHVLHMSPSAPYSPFRAPATGTERARYSGRLEAHSNPGSRSRGSLPPVMVSDQPVWCPSTRRYSRTIDPPKEARG